jgi:hypothetical protein
MTAVERTKNLLASLSKVAALVAGLALFARDYLASAAQWLLTLTLPAERVPGAWGSLGLVVVGVGIIVVPLLCVRLWRAGRV